MSQPAAGTPPSEQAPAAAAAAERSAEQLFTYTPTLTVDSDDAQVETAIKTSSLLFTYVNEPLDTVGVLFTRAKADLQRVTRALNALGYFAPETKITINGGPIDDIAVEDALADKPPATAIPVDVNVKTGALFKFGRVQLVPSPGSSKEPLDALPADITGLEQGEPARSSEVVAANARIVEALRNEGHALAAVVGREAIADHATSELEVTYRIDPGPKAKFGAVSIRGNQDMDAEFLKRLAPFKTGDTFSSTTLTDYKNELERLLVFNTVAIEEAKSLDAEGQLPLTVAVSERKQHVVGVSASYSTLEGMAVGGYWAHRNLWGEAEQLRIDAKASRLFMNSTEDYEYLLSTALTIPAFPDNRDDLIITVAAKRERPDAYDRDAATLEGRIRRRFNKEFRGEIALGFTQSHEIDVLGERDRSTIQVPVALAYDTRDNLLDATKGIRATGAVQPIFNLRTGNAFASRFDAAASSYWMLGDDGDFILAARAAVGGSIADSVEDLPVDLRYFAGGGSSVRGYEYQALSPRNAVNQIIGGRSTVEGSVELRSWLWDDFGAAAFVDAGAASSSNFPDFDNVGVGVGVGVRYRTPVGPIRVDFAVPLDPPAGDSEFGIYVALGQAF